MRSWLVAAALALVSCAWWAVPASAGCTSTTCFWNPYAVTGAVAGTGNVCRLTISPAIVGSGLIQGSTISVTAITGATECNVNTTVSAVVDTTHIELTGTTFSTAYVSGGCVGGGQWTSTNTANWAATSTATCGSGGTGPPGTADTVTFDANSLSGTIGITIGTAGSTQQIASITSGAFTGTLDFSVGNNSFTLVGGSGFNSNGTATRSINFGTGTFNINFVNAGFTLGLTGLTILPSGTVTAPIQYNGTNCGAGFTGLGLTYTSLTIACTNGAVSISGADTFNTLTINPGNTIFLTGGITYTVGTLNANGTAASPVSIINTTTTSQATLTSSSNQTLNFASVTGVAFAGTGTWTANNSFSTGHATGITINAPGGAGGRSFMLDNDFMIPH